MKPIKSTDPRKPAIVAALKRVSGANRITNVREGVKASNPLYYGDALRFEGQKYVKFGTYEISEREAFPPKPAKQPEEIIEHLEAIFKDANWPQVLGLIPELEEVQKEVEEASYA